MQRVSRMTTDSERLAYSVKDARLRLGISNDNIYNLLNSGALPARKLGKRTVILADDLNKYLERLPSYPARRSADSTGSTDPVGAVLGKSLQNRAA